LRKAGPLAYPALEAAGIERALLPAAHVRNGGARRGISIFELARLMGTTVAMIDRTYGHLTRNSEERLRAALDARAAVKTWHLLRRRLARMANQDAHRLFLRDLGYWLRE
jgi:hypothetical protein